MPAGQTSPDGDGPQKLTRFFVLFILINGRGIFVRESGGAQRDFCGQAAEEEAARGGRPVAETAARKTEAEWQANQSWT